MPQSHSIAVVSFFFLCIFLFIYFVFYFELYMYLFGHDFNNLMQRQAEYFFFIDILTSVLIIQSYLFLNLNFFLNSYLPSNYKNVVQCFHIQMVGVPFLRNNPSAVMFFQRLYFPPKHSGKNIRSASGFFIAGNPFVKKPGLPFLHFHLI